jgi:3-oxoacyl-[acyl-carrier-protein] synthase-1
MVDLAGEPMKVASVPWLDLDVGGIARLEALLFPAIDQVLEWSPRAGLEVRTALALAVPSPRPGLAPDISMRLRSTISSRYSSTFVGTAVFPNGHAAGLVALEAVTRKFARGAFDACVIAGVDSYLEPPTLEWLEENDQLHGAGRLNNAWGFVPGEAAGAVLLVRPGIAERCAGSLLAQVLGIGTATEPNCIKTQTVCIGAGLTQAFKSAFETLPKGNKVTDVYCDMNGEPYRADEYGFTCLRTKDHFESASDFVAPADCWGDVAAAGVPLHIGLAAIAGSKGYANGSMACIWASSEQGERGAVVLRVIQREARAC